MRSAQEGEQITRYRVGAQGVRPQWVLKVFSSHATAPTHAGKLPRPWDSGDLGKGGALGAREGVSYPEQTMRESLWESDFWQW